MKQQIIALIDCDSFFVSCEKVDNPSLQGKPVCVMTSKNNKGISITEEGRFVLEKKQIVLRAIGETKQNL